jgi:hypothetical protein
VGETGAKVGARALRFVPPRVRRLGRVAGEVFPLTAVGVVVGAGAGLALGWYGLSRMDLILLVVGAVGASVLSLCLVLVSVTALVLWARLRRLEPSPGEVRLECGVAWGTGFSVRNLWFVPLVTVSWDWSRPLAKVSVEARGGRLHERVVPLGRALSDQVERRFVVADVFGLCRVAFAAVQRRSIHFVPSVGALGKLEVVRSMAGGEDLTHPDGPPTGERVDLRSYQRGDPVRFILWKVFARTRQVVVRTPERALGPVRQIVAYQVSGAGDEPAAGAARVAVEEGALGGDWVLGADGDVEPTRTKDAALATLSRSAGIPEEGQGAGLARFLTNAVPGARVARALVFVPAVPGPWIDRVVEASRVLAAAGSLELVVCCDGIVKGGAMSRLDRVVRAPAAPADPSAGLPASQEDLGRVLRGLSRARCSLLVVDRQTGQVYPQTHLSRLIRAA